VVRVGKVLRELVQRDGKHDADPDGGERAPFVHVEHRQEEEGHQGDGGGGVEPLLIEDSALSLAPPFLPRTR